MRSLVRNLRTRTVLNYGNGAKMEVGLTPPRYFKQKGFPKVDKIYLKIKEADYKSQTYFMTADELLALVMLGAEILSEKFKIK